MALTKCPECKKEISDKAVFCPHCGYPVGSDFEFKLLNMHRDIVPPKLPNDLSIGGHAGWTFDEVEWVGEYDGKEFKANRKFSYERRIIIDVRIHKHGIKLKHKGLFGDTIKQLHFRQIIKIEKIDLGELKERDIIGPAALGGLMLGPIGAIIGGMSDAGKKDKIYFLGINYWDLEEKKAKTLILTMDRQGGPIESLIEVISEVKKSDS